MTELSIRAIRPPDDAAIAAIIREVMTAFGASGAGFAIHDAEVDHMSGAYAASGHAYFVVAEGEHGGPPHQAGRVLGGAGIAPRAPTTARASSGRCISCPPRGAEAPDDG